MQAAVPDSAWLALGVTLLLAAVAVFWRSVHLRGRKVRELAEPVDLARTGLAERALEEFRSLQGELNALVPPDDEPFDPTTVVLDPAKLVDPAKRGLRIVRRQAALALADDTQPVDEPIVDVIAPAPEPEPAPTIPEPAPPALAEEPVLELAGDPATARGHVALPICHSGSGKTWTWISPDANGYNGHQHHQADVVGLDEATCLAKNPTVDPTPFVLVAWPMPSWIDSTTPSWPQGGALGAPLVLDLATKDLNALDAQLATTCGTQFQVDGYNDNATTRSLIAGAVLNGPGNPPESLWGGGWGEAYKLVKTADCPPPPVECSTTGDWYTELDDVAPVQTIDGLAFRGGSGKAVGYGTPISGNLQGLADIAYVATGALDVFYPRIVIDSTADGGYAYDSLTVISEGPVTGSSIAASNKRGFVQHTLDEWAALLPHNQLVALLFHLDSGAAAGQDVILQGAASDCLGLDVVIPQPPAELGTDTRTGELECTVPADGTGSIESFATDWTQPYVPNADRTAWVLGDRVYGDADDLESQGSGR